MMRLGSRLCRFVSESLGVHEMVGALPSFPACQAVRNWVFGNSLSAVGSNVVFARGVLMRYPHRVEIGNNVYVNRGVSITARARIVIGDDVLIGPRVIMDSGNHVFEDGNVPIRLQGFVSRGISVGDDVWIGAGCVVLDGVTIGRGSVVGAGSVVTRDVAPGSVVGGVPARVLRMRDQDQPG
jgi:acetyltransferase-like isoleucine patch superfamily enzyme